MLVLKRLIVLWIAIAGVAASANAGAPSSAAGISRASAIKAGMVLNFIRYTEWPEATFDAQNDPIVLTVLGEGEMADALEQTMSDQQVHGRVVQVRRLAYPEPPPGKAAVSDDDMSTFVSTLRASHVLFVCDSEKDHLDAVFAKLDAANVLTVGDLHEFAEQGGMLGLTIRQDKVAFDANTDKIEATQLKVSSKLLRLARTVDQ